MIYEKGYSKSIRKNTNKGKKLMKCKYCNDLFLSRNKEEYCSIRCKNLDRKGE